jgi:hypothetical protein
MILDESWDCYFAIYLFKFSECFVVVGVMKRQDYIWKSEKKRTERGIFQENVYEIGTGE